MLEAVEELDLAAFDSVYREDGWGRAAHEPAMMVALLVYSYSVGVRSARGIERRCREDVAFRVITANQVPDHATSVAAPATGRGLCASDRVALGVTGNAWEIARILERHVGEVLVVHPGDTGIRKARAKTDRLDARALARLLAGGSLDGLWMPDEQTRALRRRLARRSQLVRARTRAKVG